MDPLAQLALVFHLIHLEGAVCQALALDQEVALIQTPGKVGVIGPATVQALVQGKVVLSPLLEEVGAAGMAAAGALVWDRIVGKGRVLMPISWHQADRWVQSSFTTSPCSKTHGSFQNLLCGRACMLL